MTPNIGKVGVWHLLFMHTWYRTSMAGGPGVRRTVAPNLLIFSIFFSLASPSPGTLSNRRTSSRYENWLAKSAREPIFT